MLVVAAAVATAILGTTLACMNTGVRVTYAISRDTEVPNHSENSTQDMALLQLAYG